MASRATPSMLPYGDDSGIPSPSLMLPAPATIEISTARCQADTAAVVAAVEMLQQRKLRPDNERIFSYLEKHFPNEVHADPQLADRLINEALSKSLIVLVDNLNILSFRTPSKIGRMMRVTKIIAWEGEVPHSVVLEVLQVIGAVEEAAPDSTEEAPKGIGVSVKEILDKLHDSLRLLNYNAKIITQKVMPIAINEGLAKMLPRQFFTLTPLCRNQLDITLLPSSCGNPIEGNGSQDDHHGHFSGEESSPGTSQVMKPVRTSKKLKRDSNGSNCSSNSNGSSRNFKNNNTVDKFSDSDLSPGAKSGTSSTSSSRRRPREEEGEEEEEEEEEEEDTNDIGNGMEDTSERGSNAETDKELTTSEIESKEVNDDSSKGPEGKDISNVPQRVSTRKRFKKSLGPDFVDSSDQMAYYMKEPNASLKCGMCNVLLAKGKPSIMGRKTKQGSSNDKQELDKNLIQCSSCVLKVHIACLLLKEQIGSKSQWKCAACGICSVCSIKSKRKEFIISCTECKRGFHTCCTSVGRTSPDNTTWHCAHCVEADQEESANTSEDLPKPKPMTLSIKPIGKQISPTYVTNNGTIASKSLLPKASTSTPTSSLKARFSKVNHNTITYTPKETTMLLPKPTNIEVPTSNSLLMPVSMNFHNSTALRPPATIIHSNGTKKKTSKKIKKNGSEIVLFRKAERPQNQSVESSSMVNGGNESAPAKPPPSQKSVKVKKNKNKSKQKSQSLIKPVDKPAVKFEVKEEENEAMEEPVQVINSTFNSTSSPQQPPSPLPLPSVSQPLVQEKRKRLRSGPNVRMIFGDNSCPELKHNFVAWVSCELKHLVKFDPKPFSSLSNNVPKWSCQEVSLFLNSIGFASSAKFALDNQVDGMSMLLLSRQDIVSRFPIKLGPALKLYAFLTRLRKEFDLF